MTKAHPLDRPVWNSLASRQAGLALGDARAVRFAPDYGLFAAAADRSGESLAALAALIPEGGGLARVEAEDWGAVPGAAGASHSLVQMTAGSLTAGGPAGFAMVELGEAEAAEMLALATLTEPGPFFGRTHQLGDFVGVKDAAGRLIAMAGERMKPTAFTEVSGVCTHPDHRGRGYAGALMRVVAARILGRGEIPFLHAYAHNEGAIGLYRSLGFSVRREMTMTVLTRA